MTFLREIQEPGTMSSVLNGVLGLRNRSTVHKILLPEEEEEEEEGELEKGTVPSQTVSDSNLSGISLVTDTTQHLTLVETSNSTSLSRLN